MSAITDLHAMDWKLKKDLADTIMRSRGLIFGGYVRDSILHDYFSEKYYKACLDQKVTPAETCIRYNDPEFFPEYNLRTLIPDDIDCFFENKDHLKAFENALMLKKYTFHRVFNRENASEYLHRLNVPDGSLTHIRYEVKHISSHKKSMLRKLIQQSFSSQVASVITPCIDSFMENMSEQLFAVSPVYIDCLVKQNPDVYISPPFGALDFECNGLVLSKDGIALCEQLKEKQIAHGFLSDINKLKRVIDDLYERKAVLVKRPDTTVDTFRLEKMKNKGWNIVTGNYLNIVPLDKSDPEETCIICHSTLDDPHYKLKCCAARYHKNCLVDSCLTGTAAMAITNKCIMCKKPTERICHDICILQVA